MTGEFERQLKQMKLGDEVTERIVKMINAAGDGFPCLSCVSKANCDNFKWFIKWFRKTASAQ
jgi:hypothetical protein